MKTISDNDCGHASQTAASFCHKHQFTLDFYLFVTFYYCSN